MTRRREPAWNHERHHGIPHLAAEGFTHPERVEFVLGYHLRPIRADDVDIDYPAVMGSRERLWQIYGESWDRPPATMTYEADRDDLARHEREIAAHVTFNYTILDDADEQRLVGCVYIDPHDSHDAKSSLVGRRRVRGFGAREGARRVRAALAAPRGGSARCTSRSTLWPEANGCRGGAALCMGIRVTTLSPSYNPDSRALPARSRHPAQQSDNLIACAP
ncbi:hypothetical protein [Agromyces bauzanensis]|uniref:N-acetyltransferase n=1 Tax=Agromyces bauzanensis TaxID=1308924 RepID=A0A917PTY4_9MICO|nr:hypothetical protein [Agromyces bauzanensis]GGJ91709.1 hypothetical protein GCM10011372_32720 [Agromyces bauzanensis]